MSAQPQSPEKEAWVWHCADGSDLATMHDFILLQVGDKSTVFECATGGGARAVETVLKVAGFLGGGGGSGVEVMRTEVADRGFIKLRGFRVDPSDAVGLEMEIRSALAGNMGGLIPALAAVSVYHRAAHFVLEHIWAAAGKPTVEVRSPAMAQGPGRLATPSKLLTAAWGDPRYAGSCRAAGEEQPEESDTAGSGTA